MTYLTMEAEIDHGRIIPLDPDKLPSSGRALLTILTPASHKPDWSKIKKLMGTLKTKVDGPAWQRQIRADWDNR